MTIYLCGFMGCGKSTVGKMLAKETGLRFTDMDAYIVQCERMSIPDIFSEMGEEYFRARESRAVKELGDLGGIIACGGGAMLKKENSDAAQTYGAVVYLDVPFDICYERIKDDTNRPIVMRSTKAELSDIYEKRKALYTAHSTLQIEASAAPLDVVRTIIDELTVRGFIR
ncbi:MAG: shikimate kinase [Oscillospiraceae bacterium]|nr:shikimate kinase [Oscillospiraceae bacterium]